MAKLMLTAFAAFLVLLGAGDLSAATLTSFKSKDGKVVAILKGEIAQGDADQLTSIIRSANETQRYVSGIRLNSPGGNLAEGVKIADIIRSAKMATVVPTGATCASACFVAFAAGAEKFVSNSAAVGVHGASENGAETPASSAATIAMARIVKDLGVPSNVLGKMVVTPPNEVVWLTPNDLRAMGATMTGKPAQVATAAPNGDLPPHQLSSDASPIQANVAPTWKSFTDSAFAISASQNSGKAAFNRVCQPELRICSNALFLRTKDGNQMMVRTTENISGAWISREICSFNSFGDVRKCVNWDTNAVQTDMKDAKGEWLIVANQ